MLKHTCRGDAENLIPLIRKVIKEEVTNKLDDLERKINEITLLHTKVNKCEAKVSELEDSITFNGNVIKDLTDEIIPSLENKFMDITKAVCHKILEIEVHRRKWSLIIIGLDGVVNEGELDTRRKLRKFGSEQMKLTNVSQQQMSACHRLSQKENAPIIAKFVDLDDRNEWLSNAKNLKGSKMNVSISPDIPPILRPLKKDILEMRKRLPSGEKEHARVKYLPRWPCICLEVKGQPRKISTIKQETLISNYLALEA